MPVIELTASLGVVRAVNRSDLFFARVFDLKEIWSTTTHTQTLPIFTGSTAKR